MKRLVALACAALVFAQTSTAQSSGWLDRLFDRDDNTIEDLPGEYVPFPGIAKDGLPPNSEFSPRLDGPMPDLSGRWDIRVARPGDCTLNGFATLRRQSSAADDYACELTIRDYCPLRHDGVIRQTCQLDISNGQIYVEAEVVESLNGATLSGYSPDNFYLWPRMDGSLVGNLDSYGSYDAQWTRAIGATS